MSETLKAICIIGGDVRVALGQKSNKDGYETDFTETWLQTKNGLCERPRSCIRRELCTGDVRVAIAGKDIGFSSIVQAKFTESIDLEKAISYKPSHAELYEETLKQMIALKNKRS